MITLHTVVQTFWFIMTIFGAVAFAIGLLVALDYGDPKADHWSWRLFGIPIIAAGVALALYAMKAFNV